MISKIKYNTMFAFFILVSSCQSNAKVSLTCSSLASDILPERINTDLIINTPYGKSSYSIKEDLVLLAYNYSRDILEVAPDKDLEVYLWNNSEWTQIKNNLDYLSKIDRIGVKSSDDPGGQIYNIFYDTSLIQKPTKFCIVLRAVKDPENTHVAIASYIEVKINP